MISSMSLACMYHSNFMITAMLPSLYTDTLTVSSISLSEFVCVRGLYLTGRSTRHNAAVPNSVSSFSLSKEHASGDNNSITHDAKQQVMTSFNPASLNQSELSAMDEKSKSPTTDTSVRLLPCLSTEPEEQEQLHSGLILRQNMSPARFGNEFPSNARSNTSRGMKNTSFVPPRSIRNARATKLSNLESDCSKLAATANQSSDLEDFDEEDSMINALEEGEDQIHTNYKGAHAHTKEEHNVPKSDHIYNTSPPCPLVNDNEKFPRSRVVILSPELLPVASNSNTPHSPCITTPTNAVAEHGIITPLVVQSNSADRLSTTSPVPCVPLGLSPFPCMRQSLSPKSLTRIQKFRSGGVCDSAAKHFYQDLLASSEDTILTTANFGNAEVSSNRKTFSPTTETTTASSSIEEQNIDHICNEEVQITSRATSYADDFVQSMDYKLIHDASAKRFHSLLVAKSRDHILQSTCRAQRSSHKSQSQCKWLQSHTHPQLDSKNLPPTQKKEQQQSIQQNVYHLIKPGAMWEVNAMTKEGDVIANLRHDMLATFQYNQRPDGGIAKDNAIINNDRCYDQGYREDFGRSGFHKDSAYEGGHKGCCTLLTNMKPASSNNLQSLKPTSFRRRSQSAAANLSNCVFGAEPQDHFTETNTKLDIEDSLLLNTNFQRSKTWDGNESTAEFGLPNDFHYRSIESKSPDYKPSQTSQRASTL